MFTTKKSETATSSKASTLPKPTPRATENNAQHTIPSTANKEKTVISKDCIIKGEILGANDISVLGKIEGSIMLKNNILTVEESGDVKANISAKAVNIIGTITGNIDAVEKIIIYEKGNVTGDMNAPKVILKDGSYFKGNVSMSDSKVDVKTKVNKPT